MNLPPTRYTCSGDATIAYQVLGTGPCDLVVITGPASHLELVWDEPRTAHTFRRMSEFACLILHDRRGTGLSDPVWEPPTLEQQVEWAGARRSSRRRPAHAGGPGTAAASGRDRVQLG